MFFIKKYFVIKKIKIFFEKKNYNHYVKPLLKTNWYEIFENWHVETWMKFFLVCF